jgi:lipopolysaccharide transport system permease protein
MIELIRELIKYRELLLMITWRDIHIKYKQSIMGFMWAVLMPMLIVSAGMLVRLGFSIVSKTPLRVSDIAAVSLKAVPWAFFIASIRFATNSLVGNANLVTKIYFPRAVFPVAAVFSQLFDFSIAASVLIIFCILLHTGLSLHLLWVPALILILVLIAMGAGIFLSAANLFYRDVKYLVEVILTFAIFITPVFYDVSMFGKWADLLMLNPVAPILEGLTACVVYHREPPALWIAYSAVFSLVITSVALVLFRRMEPLFAERI